MVFSVVIPMINILLIGLGPHARRIHYPIILADAKALHAQIRAIVDIASQETVIRNYLSSKGSNDSAELLFLDPELAAEQDGELVAPLAERLDTLVQRHHINAVFICTEPTRHVTYAKWALRRGLHVLMDKPISAPTNLATNQQAIRQLTGDYRELAALYQAQKLRHPRLVFELMAQRRYHPAFHEIDRRIQEVKQSTGVPITSFQSLHCDGQWRMPDEIVDQSYHPYNEGYGKCLHSGYHAIDITDWLVRRSYKNTHALTDVDVFANFVYPNDFLAQLPLANYHKLFTGFEQYRKYSPEILLANYRTYGEIDAQISTTYKDQDNRTVTTGQLALLHNGFGQRNWPTAAGRDLYKGNGRVRHESHYLVQGPFQTIVYQSLQSEEILNEAVNHDQPGGEYHLDIHIFRNSKMFPQWQSYEKLSVKDLSLNILEGYSRGHQEDARRATLVTFLRAIEDPTVEQYSDLLDHHQSVGLIEAAYQSALNRKMSVNPLVKLSAQRHVDRPLLALEIAGEEEA